MSADVKRYTFSVNYELKAELLRVKQLYYPNVSDSAMIQDLLRIALQAESVYEASKEQEEDLLFRVMTILVKRYLTTMLETL